MKSTQGLAVLMVAGLAASASAHPIKPNTSVVPSADQIPNFYLPPVTDAYPFTDNFDSYANGAGISTVGNGWEKWNGSSVDGNVTNSKSFSAPNSFSTNLKSDNIQRVPTGSINSGKWTLKAKVYMPASQSALGGGWIIGMNTFIDGSGTSENWSVQIGFDTATIGNGLIGNSNANNVTIPMVFDKWLDVAIHIDLDVDEVWAEVDTGTGFQKVIDPPYQWSCGTFCPGARPARRRSTAGTSTAAARWDSSMTT